MGIIRNYEKEDKEFGATNRTLNIFFITIHPRQGNHLTAWKKNCSV